MCQDSLKRFSRFRDDCEHTQQSFYKFMILPKFTRPVLVEVVVLNGF